MLHHHCRRNPELQEELQIQAAVAAGDVHTVRKMLEQGYSPNGRDANGWTLLHFSAARGKERCVRVFLEHGGWLINERAYVVILSISDFVLLPIFLNSPGFLKMAAAFFPPLAVGFSKCFGELGRTSSLSKES